MTMLLETRSWRSELQRRLEREMLATMEVVCGGEETLQVTPSDLAQAKLNFGPYGTSPLSGLHFETADDTATS
jgi:hypothetical protein